MKHRKIHHVKKRLWEGKKNLVQFGKKIGLKKSGLSIKGNNIKFKEKVQSLHVPF